MTLNEKPDSSIKIVKTKTLPPAEGERRAMRGYMGQYERAGAADLPPRLDTTLS